MYVGASDTLKEMIHLKKNNPQLYQWFGRFDEAVTPKSKMKIDTIKVAARIQLNSNPTSGNAPPTQTSTNPPTCAEQLSTPATAASSAGYAMAVPYSNPTEMRLVRKNPTHAVERNVKKTSKDDDEDV
mmetsp:Transcript_1738/g.2599  ORF Transcript_1738/g.2599 Transcript_1738/m.2599 type:complete len:128 (-) Transcript_1738:1425-1808(-)